MRRLLVLGRWLVAGSTFALVGIGLLGFVYERVQRRASADLYPAPGSMLDVEGRRMHLHCEGVGSPTVILEAGQDVRGSLSWYPVQAELSATTRVCSYDRAGILWSEPGPSPRTSASVARELALLLETARESGPFVLVGHSMGGIHIRNFADLDRSAVVGLVFVDSSHPEQEERLPAEMSGGPPALVRGIVKILNGVGLFRFVDLGPTTSMPDSVNRILARFRPSSNVGSWAEFETSPESLASARDSPGFGDLPIVVLTAGAKPSYASQELFDRTHAVMVELHQDLALLSTAGVHRVVPDASHYIQEDRPDVVIEAVTWVVEEARKRSTGGLGPG